MRPALKQVNIIRARAEHAETLTNIAFSAKRHWGYPERWIEEWGEMLTIPGDFILSHETYAAIVDSRIVGFYALAQKDDRGELRHMWVLPEAMGRGIGRTLFLHALDRVRALGHRALEIESDPNAEGFYQRMGAQRVGSIVREVEHRRRELPILVCHLAGVGEA